MNYKTRTAVYSFRFVVLFTVVLALSGCLGPRPKPDLQLEVQVKPKTCGEPFRFARYSSVRKFDLVFEGGGAKGSVFVGALQEFEKRKYAGRRFVGTSAGAITATLMAAGYRADEMMDAVNEKLPDGKPRFSSFMDIPEKFDKEDILNSVTYKIFQSTDLPLIPERIEKNLDEHIISQLMKSPRYRELFSLVEKGGIYEGRKFREWLEEKLDANCRNLGGVTLKQFHEKTGNDLTLVASDATAHRMLILSHRTAPDCPISWAVRMSMSIPFVWQEVKWKKEWGEYSGDDITGHIVVDGGVLSNFPIALLYSREGEQGGGISNVEIAKLGFLIDETIVVPGVALPPEKKDSMVELANLKTVKRVKGLVDTMTDAHDNQAIREHEREICRLPAKGFGTTEFDMSKERQDALVLAGRAFMKTFLDSHGY